MKTSLFYLSTLAVLAMGLPKFVSAQSAFTESTVPGPRETVLPQDYWFAPIQNDTDLPGKTLELTVGAEQNTVAYVQFGDSKVLKVPLLAGHDSIVSMPLDEELKSSGLAEPKAVHVWAYSAGILCQFVSSAGRSSDAMRLLPLAAADTAFVVAGYSAPYGLGDQPSEFAVTASADSTILDIIPSCDLRYSKTFPADTETAFPAKVPFHVILNRGECIQFQSAGSGAPGTLDVTGTVVHSNQPVGVVGGSMRPQIPDLSQPPASYVCDMIPPISAWGKVYYTRESYSTQRDVTGQFLFIASKPGQSFFWNSCAVGTTEVPAQIDSMYGVTWAELPAPSKIWSDAPFLLAQYTNGDQYGSTSGPGPSEVVLPAITSFSKSVLFQGPGGMQADIIFNKNDIRNVLLDGAQISANVGSPCVNDTFEIYHASELWPGLHSVRSDSGADVLLLANNDSAVEAWSGYPVGSASSDTIPPAVSFTENAACLRATVSDSGSGLSGFYLDSAANMSFAPAKSFVPGSGSEQTFADACVNDISTPGTMEFKVFDKAGNYRTVTITFDPSQLTTHPGYTVQSLNFDTVLVHTSKTLPLLTVMDTSSDFPVVLTRIWTNDPSFLFDGSLAANLLPDTLAPGQSHTFSLTFQPTADGLYRGTFNVASGALPVRTAMVTGIGYSQLAGVTNENAVNRFELTPNPATSRVLLQYSVPASTSVELGIYSVLGTELLHWHSASGGEGEQSIDLDGLPPGVYIYRFQTSAGVSSGKLAIQP